MQWRAGYRRGGGDLTSHCSHWAGGGRVRRPAAGRRTKAARKPLICNPVLCVTTSRSGVLCALIVLSTPAESAMTQGIRRGPLDGAHSRPSRRRGREAPRHHVPPQPAGARDRGRFGSRSGCIHWPAGGAPCARGSRTGKARPIGRNPAYKEKCGPQIFAFKQWAASPPRPRACNG